jgi:tripartite-type tricarboxylate transporter receptor subunit TctC
MDARKGLEQRTGRDFMVRTDIVRNLVLSTPLAFGFLVSTPAAQADEIAEFYRGKSMQMIIRSTTGNEYDLLARTLARHITDHIPGKPTEMVPINMPGAGGIKAAEYMATVAPKDGTMLTIVSQGLPMYQALQLGKPMKADMKAMGWVGNMSTANQTLVVWHTSPVKTLEDAKRRVTPVGSSGAGSISVQLPAAYNNILGTKFKIIFGYPGGAEMNLAMERGEIEGRGTNTWSAWTATHSDWIHDGKIVPLIQVGLQKEPDLPSVPLLIDQAKDGRQKAILQYITHAVAVGRPIATTPGVPSARLHALRAAFQATVKDPEFIADAKRQKLDVETMDGDELQAIVMSLFDAPESVKAEVKEALKPAPVDLVKSKASAKTGE